MDLIILYHMKKHLANQKKFPTFSSFFASLPMKALKVEQAAPILGMAQFIPAKTGRTFRVSQKICDIPPDFVSII